jgi:hypothetical protein
MTGRQKKRLSALEELMDEGIESEVSRDDMDENSQPRDVDDDADGIVTDDKNAVVEREDDGGILGSIMGFYKKADSMAASQALLLNKELEDRGILEKITDETGLKVVGKVGASKQRDRDELE